MLHLGNLRTFFCCPPPLIAFKSSQFFSFAPYKGSIPQAEGKNCLTVLTRGNTTVAKALRGNEMVLDSDEAVENQDLAAEEQEKLDAVLKRMEPRTRPAAILSTQEVIDGLFRVVHPKQAQHYKSFFSSELGGIVVDPALMVVHIDDHFVHRGHGVFDTAILIDGYLYQLDQHMDRFLNSAKLANIELPFSREQMRRTILETAAASRATNGFVRYWLAAGRGGFGLSSHECISPSFYCICYTSSQDDSDGDHLKGWRVKTSPITIKDPYFASVKSNNYLPNALNVIDAETSGFDQGVFVDQKGQVAEGPNMNIGIVTHEGELVVPPFDNSLGGITVQRLLELLPPFLKKGEVPGVESISRRHITPAECKAAREVFMIGSSTPVHPILAWDDAIIGDGLAGVSCLAMRVILEKDMDPATCSGGQHTEVPYGYLTGML